MILIGARTLYQCLHPRSPLLAEGQPCKASSGPSQKDGQGCPWYRVRSAGADVNLRLFDGGDIDFELWFELPDGIKVKGVDYTSYVSLPVGKTRGP